MACCNQQRTGGSWSTQEHMMHINCFELLAAILAVQKFAKAKVGISILLRINNMTVVPSLHQPSWRNSIQGSHNPHTGPVDVVPGTEHTHHSSTPPRCSEHSDRCGVSVTQGQDRLKIEP